MKYLIISLLTIFTSFSTFAQNNQAVEMADLFRSSGKIYVVVAVLVSIFIGLAILLVRNERKISQLEKEINYREQHS